MTEWRQDAGLRQCSCALQKDGDGRDEPLELALDGGDGVLASATNVTVEKMESLPRLEGELRRLVRLL